MTKGEKMRNIIIVVLVVLIGVMARMDITPNEALYMVQYTLPNYLRYLIG